MHGAMSRRFTWLYAASGGALAGALPRVALAHAILSDAPSDRAAA
jgi:hypothetical protein